jgi:hypothetical protein
MLVETILSDLLLPKERSCAMMQAQTIDEVIQLLDSIIDDALATQNRIGYFPALYRRVTAAVKTGVEQGAFEDGERMQRLDVAFANRYFAAYIHEQPLTTSWQIAFAATRSRSPMLLQHLLLGMNAHINLDLGIAAALIAPGEAIQSIKHDFFKINMILASLVSECVAEFGKIWPIIAWGNQMLESKEDMLIAFGMDEARSSAWDTALAFAPLTGTAWADKLTNQDRWVHSLGQQVYHPPFPVNVLTWMFALTDLRSVRQTIVILNERVARIPDTRLLTPQASASTTRQRRQRAE